MYTLFVLFLGFTKIYAEITPLDEEIFTSPSAYEEQLAISEPDDVVLPIKPIRNFKLNIPEQCMNSSLCQNIPNFPHGTVGEVIERVLRETGIFVSEEMLNCDLANFDDNVLELCDQRNWDLPWYPEAAKDSTGNWNLVLNSMEYHFQGFCVTICTEPDKGCYRLASFKNSRGVCKQDYVSRKMLVLNKKMDKVIRKSFPVPSCCVCTAIKNKVND